MAEKCEQCQTEGIALLPERWGYIFENNNIKGKSRLLREGYVYILDNNGEWYGYVVTQGRYFTQFIVNEKTASLAPDLPQKDSTCYKSDSNCAISSSFIRIPNPSDNITTLWFAYSPVKWTSSVLRRHKNNENEARTRNMIEIPVSATKNNEYKSLGKRSRQSQNKGGYDLWQYDSQGEDGKRYKNYFSTEYLGDINPLTKEAYTPNKSGEASGLRYKLLDVQEDNNGSRVLSVIIDDSIGQLIDLHEFIVQTQIHFAEKDEDVRKYLVGKLVQNLKANLHKKQDVDSKRYTSRIIGQSDSDYKNAIEIARISGREEEAQRLEKEYENTIIEQEKNLPDYMKGKRDHAWSDYAKHIDEAYMNRFITSYEVESSQKLEKLKFNIDLLVKEYIDVYQGDRLLACMTHNFDKDDDISRVHYTLTVQEFIGSTANIPMLADFYAVQVNDKSAQDERNYIARALIFNQDDVAQKIEDINATAGLVTNEVLTTSWSGLLYAGSAKIFTKYDAIAKQVEAIVGLTEQLSEPFLKILRNNTMVSTLRPSRSHFLFGYHSEMGLFYVTGQGSYIQAKNALTQGILKLSGEKISQSKIMRSVEQALESLGEKSRLQTQITQQFLYFVSKEELQRGIKVYRGSQQTGADRAKLQTDISEAINTKVALSSKHYDNYKSFEDITNRDIKMANTRNFTGAMLQGVACIFLFTSVVNSSNKKEDGSKLAAGISMLIAGEVERHSNAAQFRQNNLQMMQRAGKSIDGAELGRVTKNAGRFAMIAGALNIGGAGVFAAWDLKYAYDSNQNDNMTSTGLYIGSALTGLTSTAFLVAGGLLATPGLVLLVAFIGINLFIGFWIKSGMENWLLFGTWGKQRNSSWSIKHELEQYEKAVAGEDIDLKDN